MVLYVLFTINVQIPVYTVHGRAQGNSGEKPRGTNAYFLSGSGTGKQDGEDDVWQPCF